MHCVGVHTLVPVLFVAVLITLFLLETFSLLVISIMEEGLLWSKCVD